MPIEGMAGTIIKGLKDLGFLWPPLHFQCRILCSLKGKIVFVEPTVTSGKWLSLFFSVSYHPLKEYSFISFIKGDVYVVLIEIYFFLFFF